MSISLGLRFGVLRRDNFTCRYCGATAPKAKLEVDHIVPRSRGGSDAPWNLVTACYDCNRGKGAIELDEPLLSGPSNEAVHSVRAARDVIDYLWGYLPLPIASAEFRAGLANRFVEDHQDGDSIFDVSTWSRELMAFAQGVHDASELAEHAVLAPYSMLGELTDDARKRWLQRARREFTIHGYTDPSERDIEEYAVRMVIQAYASAAGEARRVTGGGQ